MLLEVDAHLKNKSEKSGDAHNRHLYMSSFRHIQFTAATIVLQNFKADE